MVTGDTASGHYCLAKPASYVFIVLLMILSLFNRARFSDTRVCVRRFCLQFSSQCGRRRADVFPAAASIIQILNTDGGT